MPTAADVRHAGGTSSERALARLCDASFLKLWSYSSVFRDQKQRDRGDGKELCDLLVVFGDDVIIFSDKQCAFPSGPIEISWTRWFRRAVEASLVQLRGAKRWLGAHPDRLYLDRTCTVQLPVELPPPDRMKIHCVAVASGAAEACATHLGVERGTLMLAPQPPNGEQAASTPFLIRHMQGELVHVLDEASLEIVLRELDTISDFVSYLNWKSAIIADGLLGFSSGEEHLLAVYLRETWFNESWCDLARSQGRTLFLDENIWDGLVNDPRYLAWKRSLHVSYFWDRMVDMAAEDALAERMIAGSEDGVSGHERRLRTLARASRGTRRELSLALGSMFSTSHGTLFRVARHDSMPDCAYLFLMLKPGKLGMDEYRRVRSELLRAYTYAWTWRNSDVRHVVGVATGPGQASGSQEIMYIDRVKWTDDDARDAERLERAFKILGSRDHTSLDSNAPLQQPATRRRKYML